MSKCAGAATMNIPYTTGSHLIPSANSTAPDCNQSDLFVNCGKSVTKEHLYAMSGNRSFKPMFQEEREIIIGSDWVPTCKTWLVDLHGGRCTYMLCSLVTSNLTLVTHKLHLFGNHWQIVVGIIVIICNADMLCAFYLCIFIVIFKRFRSSNT